MNQILAHGGAFDPFDYFPVLFIVGAVYVIRVALKDAPRRDSSTRALPTSHLSRQMHSATRPKRRASGPAAAGFRQAAAQRPRVDAGEERPGG